MKVIDHGTKELLKSLKVFDEQTIHGIVCHPYNQGNNITSSCITVLVWGGRYVSMIELVLSHDSNSTEKVHMNALPYPVDTGDWILDACFINPDTDESHGASTSIWAFLVNAHNNVLMLQVIMLATPGESMKPIIKALTSGPPSMLYSAHIFATNAGSVLIAAGTFFGEIILWSLIPGPYDMSQSVLHRIFRGHQGSVFGVQISEKSENGAFQRLLASCSDDRTIRIWDISQLNSWLRADEANLELESGLDAKTSEAGSVYSVAVGMGHASRIWGLRFLGQRNGYWGLISYGEDATAQTWLFCPKPSDEAVPPKSRHSVFELQHLKTYRYHSGKNIHAIAIFKDSPDSCLIADGGADGQITSYYVAVKELGLEAGERSHHHRIDDIYTAFPTGSTVAKGLENSSPRQPQPQAGDIFHTLSGCWQLSRKFLCKSGSENFGNLEGTATFTTRHPIDDPHDGEKLYSEVGDFVTTKGFKFETYRHYVWRFDTLTQTIDVWFVKADDQKSVDYLYHTLEFPGRDNERPRNANIFEVTASGDHLCDKDNYQVTYNFQIENRSVTRWTSRTTVSGPTKDYVLETTYTRKVKPESHHDNESTQTQLLTSEPKAKRQQITLQPQSLRDHSQKPKDDAFKTFCWLNKKEFLVSTEKGILLLGTLQHGQHNVLSISYHFIASQENLESSCIATSIRSPAVAWLTGSEGSIYLYRHSTKTLKFTFKLPSKVAHLQAQVLPVEWGFDSRADCLDLKDNPGGPFQVGPWERNKIGIVAARLRSSSLSVIFFEVVGADPPTKVKSIEIKLPADFVVTSSYFVEKEGRFLVLGSRKGDLAIWDISKYLKDQMKPPLLRVLAHDESVTSIMALQDESAGSRSGAIFLVTTGRDGRYKLHELTMDFRGRSKGDDVPLLVTVHDCKLPFGPFIEGAYFSPIYRELIVWGFRSKAFVVWNESQKAEVLSVECGNAHRSWDFIPHDRGNCGGSFIWTQAKLCHVCFQGDSSHRIIHSGGHGREIKAIALSPSIQAEDNSLFKLLATGAEDTIVRLFDCKPVDDSGLKSSSIVKGHTTGIQQLRWSEDGRRLFSAAGYEEFFVWRIRLVPRIGLGVICEAVCPKVTDSSDLRVMDFDVVAMSHTEKDPEASSYLLTMAYSDSSLRLFLYQSWREQKFTNVFNGPFGANCLTQTRFFGSLQENELYVCTASTNGGVDLWLLCTKQSLQNAPLFFEETPQWKRSLVNHASSAKCLDLLDLSPTESLIISGGDRGSVAFTYMKYSKQASQNILVECTSIMVRHYHASAVTGLKCIRVKQGHTEASLLFASVGNDQRLKLGKIRIDKRTVGPPDIRYVTLADEYTNVGDAAALEQFDDEDGRWLLVAGIGTETWRIVEA